MNRLQFIRQPHGLTDTGDSLIITVVGLQLVQSGGCEFVLGLQHIHMSGGAGAKTSIGQTCTLLRLLHDFIGGLGELGGLLEIGNGTADIDIHHELRIGESELGLLEK